MKVRDLIAQLQELDQDKEIVLTSCCYPDEPYFGIDKTLDGEGYQL